MNLNVDNPVIDESCADANDDAPLDGLVVAWVKIPILVPIDPAQGFDLEQQAVDYAAPMAEEYVAHAIEQHVRFLGENSPLSELDPDVSGIEIDDATEFESA